MPKSSQTVGIESEHRHSAQSMWVRYSCPTYACLTRTRLVRRDADKHLSHKKNTFARILDHDSPPLGPRPRVSINLICYPGLTSWANYLVSLRDSYLGQLHLGNLSAATLFGHAHCP